MFVFTTLKKITVIYFLIVLKTYKKTQKMAKRDTVTCIMTEPIKKDPVRRMVKRSTLLKMPNYAIQLKDGQKTLNLVNTLPPRHFHFLVLYIENGISVDSLPNILAQAHCTHKESAQIATLFSHAGLVEEMRVACKYAADQKIKNNE